MTEERVTKQIIKWLINNNWEVLAFDFPQSGTGISFKKDDFDNEKNKESIIPDIIAVKQGICTFWENKNRYYHADYEKVYNLRTNNQYKKAIDDFLKDLDIQKIYYGIGLPSDKYKRNAIKYRDMTDFILGVSSMCDVVDKLYDINNIFFE